ncbi:hypothetical protein BX666DRAFT_1963691 [Dichotomocladium elegans]|nr:hypothetical protein BX666DRAFT_1963691 [Dichotomocladium elegans]
MPIFAPYLSGGKTLQGVLLPSEHNPIESQSLVDIESCIDDPNLAPLGDHVTRNGEIPTSNRTRIMPTADEEGQVQIQKKAPKKVVRTDGVLLLRRRGMESDELAEQLNHLLPPLAPFLNPSARFQGLVELDISRNRLSHLPNNLAMLNHLKILNVSSNLLTTVPPVLYSLTQLQVLNLSQNLITSIPPDMPVCLPNLKTLCMAANCIERIDADIGLWDQMEHFQLGSVFGGNRLSHIPDKIADMHRLQELDLSHNRLRSLPSNMRLTALVHLNVSDNQLDTLPKSIAQCRNLKTLNVSKNHLTTLPADLVQLNRLELFDLSENLLCILPADILERMHTTLLITGNPLTRPGHCDIQGTGSSAYAQILRQMTMRAVSTAPRCGPHGMGCENIGDRSRSRSSGSRYHRSHSNGRLPGNRPRRHLSPQLPDQQALSNNNDDDDDDASIDRELSYHARQLNIQGSRPSTPQTMVGLVSPPTTDNTSTSSITSASTSANSMGNAGIESVEILPPEYPLLQRLPSHLSNQIRPLSSELTDEDGYEGEETLEQEQPSTHVETQGHHLVHSLRELAARTILKHRVKVPLCFLPDQLAYDLKSRSRPCAMCHDPFVNEWITSVQVKSYKGHPAVVRRVRFCSTACWQKCLDKRRQDETEEAESTSDRPSPPSPMFW